MLLVERFIGSVSPEELRNIREIQLSPVERKLLDTIISLHSKKGMESKTEELRTLLNMTGGNLRYYGASLMKKAYNALVPEGGVALLRLLAGYGLIHNFKNEIREQEKNLSKDDASRFYFAAFELSIGIVYSNIDLKTSHLLGKKYLDSLSRRTIDDSIAVELRVKQSEFLQRFTMKRHRSQTLWEFGQYLEDIPMRLNHSDHRYAQYAHAEAQYYYRYMVDPSSAIVTDLLQTMTTILPPEMAELLPETKETLQYRLLQQYEHEGDPERVYRILEDFFSAPRRNLAIPHHLQFGYYAMLTGRFAKAEELFAELVPKVLTKPPTTNTISYYEMTASLFMLTNNLPKAKHALDEAAKAHNEISRHMIFEVYLRNLELMYYALMGDCDFCLRLIDRNLNWLRKGKHDIHDGWATSFHQIVREMMTSHLYKQPPNQKIMNRIARYKPTGPDGLLLAFIEELKDVCKRRKRSSSM